MEGPTRDDPEWLEKMRQAAAREPPHQAVDERAKRRLSWAYLAVGLTWVGLEVIGLLVARAQGLNGNEMADVVGHFPAPVIWIFFGLIGLQTLIGFHYMARFVWGNGDLRIWDRWDGNEDFVIATILVGVAARGVWFFLLPHAPMFNGVLH